MYGGYKEQLRKEELAKNSDVNNKNFEDDDDLEVIDNIIVGNEIEKGKEELRYCPIQQINTSSA
eukprot:Pgem_evm1s10271